MKSKTKLAHSWIFDAIGTRWSIETDVPLSSRVKRTVGECIESFEMIYSRFRDDSTVARIARQAGEYSMGPDSAELSLFYRRLYDATDAAMTPLIGGGLVAAGYDKDYSLSPTAPLPALVWDDTMHWDASKFICRKPVVLDIGAAGKGLLVDKVADILEQSGIEQYVIDASGDIRHRGSETQIIGLENPFDTTKIIGTMNIQDSSLCASASNRRSWGDGWHHVLDGRTGGPVNDVVATWVASDRTMIADGLATALFFVGYDALKAIADFQYVRLLANGKVEHSQKFMGQLYI